tara:strand:+ start:1879 stop:2592 length:714 start_codon:yes stop_codon:yes gene_type:complete
MIENKITFSSPLKGFIPEPKPSLKYIPEGYKKLKSFINDSLIDTTVKKCIPFLDALTTGYIIPFATDFQVYYNKEKEQMDFSIPGLVPEKFYGLLGLEYHANNQITEDLMNPRRTLNTVCKFMNPWKIHTPPGYSCLFVTPFNHPLPFELITGVVDTDTFDYHINFPFYWTTDLEKRVVLKAETPMVMVFPFKREAWKMNTKICKLSEEQNNLRFLKVFNNLIDNYKRKFWQKKSYK